MRYATLILLISLALSCAACSLVPANRGELEEMQRSQETFTQASITAAAEGNESAALLYASMAGVASILGTIGLSRKRRTEAALVQTTGSKQIPSLGLPASPPLA